jgi:hypothetical protein
LSLILGYAYVIALGKGWRAIVYIHGAIFFFAGLAVFMKDAKSFLLFTLTFATAFGFGRHIVFEQMPFESVLFSAGIRIDTVDVILLILYGHWALGLGSGEKRVLPFTAGGWLGAIFLAWIACLFFLSLAVSKEPRFGLYETFAIAKGFLLFFYLVNNVTTHHDLKIIVYGLMAVGIVQSLYLVFQFITKTSYTIQGESIPSDPEGGFRSKGFFGAFDTHAMFLATILPIFLAAFLVYSQPAKRLAAVASMILLMFGAASTRARIAIASLGISVLIIPILSYQRGKISSRRTAITLIACILVGMMSIPMVYQRFAASPFGEARLPLVATALSMIKDHLIFGVGPNNYNFLVDQYVPPRWRGTWSYTVHNEYLLRIAETGILAASLYYAMIILAIMKFAESTRSQDPLVYSVSAGLFSALIASIPHRFVSIYHAQQYFTLFCIILALAYVVGRLKE